MRGKKRVTSAAEILHRRYVGDDAGRKAALEAARVHAEVARTVYQLRTEAGLTQQELADLASVGKRFIVELEDGKQTVRLDKVNQVLRAFGKRLGPVDVAKDEL